MRLHQNGRILDAKQQDAVLALLRVIADGEIMAEQARCRLCEVKEFDPYSTFQYVQGAQPAKGYVMPYDLQSWLHSQPHSLAGANTEDVTSIMSPYFNANGQMRYEGFLRLLLPKESTHGWLKEVALRRCSHPHWVGDSARCPPEVAYRLCQLLETEVDVAKHLKFHRKALKELNVDTHMVIGFLDYERGDSAVVTGLLSPGSLRTLLVDRLQELSSMQCDALLRRINPSGAYMLPTDELGRIVSGKALGETVGMPGDSHISHSFATESVSKAPLYSPSPPAARWRYRSAERPKHCNVDRTLPRLDPYGLAKGVDLGRDWSPDRKLHSSRFPISDSPRRSYALSSTRAPTPGDGGFASPRSPTWALSTPPHLRSPFQPSTWQVGARSPSPPIRPSSVPAAPGIRQGSSCIAPSALPSMRPLTPKATCRMGMGTGLGYAALEASSRSSVEKSEARRANVQTCLKTLVRQAEIDERIEDMKVLLPPSTSLQVVFRTLDRYSKGYIADTDLWQFMQDYQSRTSTFSNLCSLIHEVHLRQPRGHLLTPGQLTLRALGTMLFPINSREYEAMRVANSDAEALSILYCLYYSEPCPGCGLRVQRDADAAGCPSVTCPICGTMFRCFIVVGDADPVRTAVLPPSALYHLHRLIDLTASAAEELEQGRKQLVILPKSDALSLLSEAFSSVADGRTSMSLNDLRRALQTQDLFISERQLDLLWRRYAPDGGSEVPFTDFVRHLKPRTSTIFSMST